MLKYKLYLCQLIHCIMPITDFLFAFLAAIAAGIINAIAGGGTLVTFPVLTAIGIAPVVANVTNTVALCTGLLSGTYAQRKDFKAQKKRLWKILPMGVAGGIAGGLILLNTKESSFNALIPYLILLATILLALQVPVKNWIAARLARHENKKHNPVTLYILIFLAAIYGGYFGAGLGIILMAVLGLVIDDSLTSLNVLKQAISFCINLAAAIYFAFSGQVIWTVALVMAAGAITGGLIGGRLAGKLKPEILRWTVVSIGLLVAVIYFFR